MNESHDSIWFERPTADGVAQLTRKTMVEHLGIRFEDAGADFVKLSMPVDARTVQPDGVLHGGASIALAETAGSLGANHCVDGGRYQCFGIEVNGNHVRSATSGRVFAVATPEHVGRTTHVWSIRITDEQDRLVCISRITMAVVAKQR